MMGKDAARRHEATEIEAGARHKKRAIGTYPMARHFTSARLE
jgi:hypothetical protein